MILLRHYYTCWLLYWSAVCWTPLNCVHSLSVNICVCVCEILIVAQGGVCACLAQYPRPLFTPFFIYRPFGVGEIVVFYLTAAKWISLHHRLAWACGTLLGHWFYWAIGKSWVIQMVKAVAWSHPDNPQVYWDTGALENVRIKVQITIWIIYQWLL